MRNMSLLKRLRLDCRKFSTVLNPSRIVEEPLPIFRTSESNPTHHTQEHLNRFYTIPYEDKVSLFSHNCLPKEFSKQIKTFAECSLLVRQPAVEIISYLQNADYTRPANRYIVYGKLGTGKSLTLAHIVHYGFVNRKILVNIPWVPQWFKYAKEVTHSEKEGYVDLPIDAALWLVRFKAQNSHLFSALDLRITKDYEWNPRDKIAAGAPVLELIDFGINRVKYATKVIAFICSELKTWSTAGKCSTLVVIDCFNAFFSEFSEVRVEKRRMIPPKNVTLTEIFLDMVKSDWCNGAVVLSVDDTATKERRDSILPHYLLTNEGFEQLDPFVPVKVENYNDNEFNTVMEYYKNRKWVREITPEGERRLQMISENNPYNLMRYCSSL